MDIPNLSLTMTLSFVLFLFVTLQLVKRLKLRDSSSKKLPPGPWKLPFIGNLHQLISPLPHRTLRNLARNYGPLMHLQLGEVSSVVVSSPEMAKEVMKTHDSIFASRLEIIASKILFYDCSSVAFSPYGYYWRQLRKICTLELLSSKRVQSFRSIREQEVLNLINAVSSSTGKLINLTEKITPVSHAITSKAVIGNKVQEQEELISIINQFAKLASGFTVADLFPSFKLLHLISGVRSKLEKMFQKSDAILEAIVDDHKSGKSTKKAGRVGDDEDLVDVLLKYHEDVVADHGFALNNDSIKAVILDMIGGGSETSFNVVIWAMTQMVKNPRVMEKAQEEIRLVFAGKGKIEEEDVQDLKYLKLVIKETLRLCPPGSLLVPRVCSERCEINGYEIPRGTKIIINIWAIHRDPNYWTDAETFYPERFLNSAINYNGNHFEFIPFGAGRRMCPGISFAMANIELQLANLLFYFDWMLPCGMKPEDVDVSESYGVTVKRKKDLFLVPVPFKNFTIAA